MPHHRKYIFHSDVTLARPSRANSRTSSHASHGFFSRFSRSAFCAFVSFAGTTATGVSTVVSLTKFSRLKRKAHEFNSWVSGMKLLALCAYTTVAHAAAPALRPRQHAVMHIRCMTKVYYIPSPA